MFNGFQWLNSVVSSPNTGDTAAFAMGFAVFAWLLSCCASTCTQDCGNIAGFPLRPSSPGGSLLPFLPLVYAASVAFSSLF